MSLAAYLGYNKTDFPPVPLDRAGRASRFVLPHLPVWQKEKKSLPGAGSMRTGDFICYSKVKMKVAGLQQAGG